MGAGGAVAEIRRTTILNHVRATLSYSVYKKRPVFKLRGARTAIHSHGEEGAVRMYRDPWRSKWKTSGFFTPRALGLRYIRTARKGEEQKAKYIRTFLSSMRKKVKCIRTLLASTCKKSKDIRIFLSSVSKKSHTRARSNTQNRLRPKVTNSINKLLLKKATLWQLRGGALRGAVSSAFSQEGPCLNTFSDRGGGFRNQA